MKTANFRGAIEDMEENTEAADRGAAICRMKSVYFLLIKK